MSKAKSMFGGLTIPLTVVAGLAPGVSKLYGYYKDYNIRTVLDQASIMYLGYDPNAGKFNIKWAMQGLGPILIGGFAHKLANKIGINRMLASAGIPVFRV